MRTRTKKQKQKYSCFVCHTAYPSRNMASNCMKTQFCRRFNHPSTERLNAYQIQEGITICILYCFYPLEQQLPEGQLKKIAAEVLVDTNTISALLGKMFVNPNLFAKFQESLSNVIVDIWKPSETFSCTEAVETISILIYDLQAELEDFLDNPENLELKNLWDKVSVSLDNMLNEWNEPKRYNNTEEEINGPLGRLRQIIFPKSKERSKKPLRLFLVNDNIWIVAKTKNEVRDVIKKEFGLVNLQISGIQNTEVMENGVKASDMIALANGKTQIIGRTE